jgi:hypothetical protein
MLADGSLEQINDGDNIVRMVKKDKKMLWGWASGVTKDGRAYMESRSTVLIEAKDPTPPALVVEQLTVVDEINDLSEEGLDESSDEIGVSLSSVALTLNESVEDRPKEIVAKPAYAYLNNRWAKFVVDGREYAREELVKSRLNEDYISEVLVPISCKSCGKPWRLKAVYEPSPASPPQPAAISPTGRENKREEVIEDDSTNPDVQKIASYVKSDEQGLYCTCSIAEISRLSGVPVKTVDGLLRRFYPGVFDLHVVSLDSPKSNSGSTPSIVNFEPEICCDRQEIVYQSILFDVSAAAVPQTANGPKPPKAAKTRKPKKAALVEAARTDTSEPQTVEPETVEPETVKVESEAFEGFGVIASRNAALGYLVFPVDSGKKKASIKRFPELATGDPEQIQAWAKQFPNASCGLLATPSGHLFIDEDDSESFRQGYTVLSGDPFPTSRTTGARANHCQSHWLQTDYSRKMLKNITQDKTRDKMFSLRFRNLLVLGEGSRHPSGSLYQVVVDSPAIPMPDKLVDYIRSLVVDNRHQNEFVAPAAPYLSTNESNMKVPAQFDVLLTEPGRNDGVSRYAWYVWQNETAVRDDFSAKVHRYNQEHCMPPLDDAEVDAIINGKVDKPVTGLNAVLNAGAKLGANAIPARSASIGAPLLEFKYPRVANPPFDSVIGKALGASEGWFPLGDPSLIAGPSGANKSTLMLDLLEKQYKKEEFIGHPTFGLPYVILMADRGENASFRTAARMSFNPAEVPIKYLPMAQDQVAIFHILQKIEECDPLPAVVFIEGCDMLTSNASKMEVVSPFMKGLQRIAEHYHMAIIGSVGSAKQKIGEGYVSKRDHVFGTIAWSRMAETIAILQYVDGDDTDARRSLSVLPRNGAAEKYKLKLENGRLAVDNPPVGGMAPERKELLWCRAQTDWFTVQDVKKGLGGSDATCYRLVQDLFTKHILKSKKKAQGEARQHLWNDSDRNPESKY